MAGVRARVVPAVVAAVVVMVALIAPGGAADAASKAPVERSAPVPYPTSQKAVARAASKAWLAGRTTELAGYEAYSGRGVHLGDAIAEAVGEGRDLVGPYFCQQRWCAFVAIDFPPSFRMKRVDGRWKIAGVLNQYLYSGAYVAGDRTSECVASVKATTWLRGSNSETSSALRRLKAGKRVGVFQFDNTDGRCQKSAVSKAVSGGWAVVSFGGGKWWGYVKKSQISKPR